MKTSHEAMKKIDTSIHADGIDGGSYRSSFKGSTLVPLCLLNSLMSLALSWSNPDTFFLKQFMWTVLNNNIYFLSLLLRSFILLTKPSPKKKEYQTNKKTSFKLNSFLCLRTPYRLLPFRPGAFYEYMDFCPITLSHPVYFHFLHLQLPPLTLTLVLPLF